MELKVPLKFGQNAAILISTKGQSMPEKKLFIKPTSLFISVPDNTVQTVDLLVGVDSLIIEGQLLLDRGSAVLHICVPPVDRRG